VHRRGAHRDGRPIAADVVLTCGGTGFSPRDVTPEATERRRDRLAPGIAEAIRAGAWPSRPARCSRARARDCAARTLVINMPGSEKAARESFGFVADQLEHAVEMMAGGGHYIHQPATSAGAYLDHGATSWPKPQQVVD
jgi:molybdopterin adenylyltransferase